MLGFATIVTVMNSRRIKFSAERNGMGPLPVIPPAAVDVDEPPQLTAAREKRSCTEVPWWNYLF
eukprot:scaffold5209_cov35-Cyclotella_meneghiniana.AAC.4